MQQIYSSIRTIACRVKCSPKLEFCALDTSRRTFQVDRTLLPKLPVKYYISALPRFPPAVSSINLVIQQAPTRKQN